MIRKVIALGVMLLIIGISAIPSTGILSMEKHVSSEKPLADCSMVGDSGLSLIIHHPIRIALLFLLTP